MTEATDTQDMPVVRNVRHKTTAAALLAIGCDFHGIVRANDGWCEIEVLVSPDLKETVQKVVGNGEGVSIDWGKFRDHLRELSMLIKQQNEEG